ncbi:MAG: rod shape-determining protein RodA [Lachnospiraceae bacterium]|nr:rod shape-determining protein RodA [Lachnospiraceae bacterium]
MFRKRGYNIKNFRFSLLIVICMLSSIGLVVLRSLTVNQNQTMFKKQLLGVAAGLFILLIVSLFDYHWIGKLCIPLYIFNILLMLFCKFVDRSMSPKLYGKSVDQARRWIHIGNPNGGLDIMPSEITKIVIIVCLARLFVFMEGKINKVSSLALIALVSSVPVLLVFMQPDLSTSIVIMATILIMLFIAGLSLKIVIPFLCITIPGIIAFIWYIQQDFGSKLLKPWQRDRIISLLHPEDYPDLMYQQNNAKAAIKAGKIFGKMITAPGDKRLTDYVPVVESDFIFSAVGEELGFVGTMLVVILFLAFLFISLHIALEAKDKLGKYIAAGIAVMITIQAFVNIGVVLSLLPNTGIPLPFMSNGLSSLLTNFMVVGILLNIGMQNKDVNPVDDDVIVFGKYHKQEI